jgi:hypothetical protein
LIEINTTDSVGSTTVAAQAMAKRSTLRSWGRMIVRGTWWCGCTAPAPPSRF